MRRHSAREVAPASGVPTLRSASGRARPTLGRRSAVARAARGAHEMHEAGGAHRGIGPTNILLDHSGAVLGEPAVAHLLTHGHTLGGLGAVRADRLELVDPELMSGHPAGRLSPRLKVNQALSGINNLLSLSPIRSAFEGEGTRCGLTRRAIR